MATTTSSDDFLVCNACGTQFNTSDRSVQTNCHICDDPRQFVPPTGQSFTTLSTLRASTAPKYTNKHQELASDKRFISLWTEPKIGIGQRAILVRTPAGNIMWDCVAFLDDDTISYINGIGGLRAILISHPHYYTTHLEWAKAFDCPVYLAREDEEWLARPDTDGVRKFIEVGQEAVDVEQTGVKAVKLGGHFPGSLVALWEGRLLIADTLLMTPAGIGNWGEKGRPKGMNSFSFMWSIPNFIPLGPQEISRMWNILKQYDFRSVHGAFVGTEIVDDNAKRRVLESMQIQVRNEEYLDHSLLLEKLQARE